MELLDATHLRLRKASNLGPEIRVSCSSVYKSQLQDITLDSFLEEEVDESIFDAMPVVE